MTYCRSLYHYERRLSRVVTVGDLKMGGDEPIRVQSMLTSDTMDTEACVRETLGLVAVGCEIVRITAPTVKDAANLKNIHEALRAVGCEVPLVADIHFKPDAALEAAQWVEKVRINPGNFADSKKFHVREYSDIEYETELERIRDRFAPLVHLCKERGVAMRIGTNHGSLSDRIMNRFGDSPRGMVESALEFAHIARDLDYHEFVFSMKASNPKVMIEAYRLLIARLEAEGSDWNYPIHLGVTEAGDGEDGRIKSAIGIGSLLADGIGDTVRVSLTEDSEREIPVAQALVRRWQGENGSQDADYREQVAGNSSRAAAACPTWPLFSYERRTSESLCLQGVNLGGEEPIRVVVLRETYQAVAPKLASMGEYQPELIEEDLPIKEIDPSSDAEVAAMNAEESPTLVTVRDGTAMSPIAAFRMLAARLAARHPILLKDTLDFFRNPTGAANCDVASVLEQNSTNNLLASATTIGSLLCDGIGDAIMIRREKAPGASLRLAYNILQAAGTRIFKTDYVACPSCGRTLFNLQNTTARIKAATGHLKGVRLAVMGCIVNGPGEMADADFGYVGGAPGKINLYVGKKPIKFNIPEAEAVEQLVQLIREHGKWVDAVV
ncbi:MAG: 4-hydroxy-3-methylbut-2-en-1-yl diphosphate synthase [Verrucomicrobia bacterium RIFCSPHIGHO2_12_FULL_41_10]|nr:MAG: 4-hydroxy-3-methylbut-2-en-1-yl diphosphate synthase [Verrucomicrobia bacterium RIFCSPHIGHO2_12_FULL_41_10]HLB34860.1 (E)-4-hydroxy-3-methylbut-2-enyl-diphosphate synthase [Chthoniobacterales bacterium]